MNCDQVAAFISELFDGELIPRDAARHLDRCRACRQRLADYSLISAELKRFASALPEDPPPQVDWKAGHQRPRSFLNFGTQTMGIPRFAFALMLAAIVVLSTGLVLVRARNNPVWWLEMNVRFPPRGALISSIVSSTNFQPHRSQLDFVQPLTNSQLAWTVRLIESKDGAQKLGIRAREVPLSLDQPAAIEQAHSGHEQVNWYSPGSPIQIEVPGSAQHLTITTETLDKSPWAHYTLAKQSPQVPQGFIGLNFPVLLRDGSLIGSDSTHAGAETSGDGIVALYIPGTGAFLFSREAFADSSPAAVDENHVTFSFERHSYLLLTSVPVASFNGAPEHTIWVRHLPKFKFRTSDGKNVAAVFTLTRSQLTARSHR